MLRTPTVDEFLASDWPYEFAIGSNGENEDYDGGCLCCRIDGVGFLVEVHCWRSGMCCEFSGIHVTGDIDDATKQKLAEHIRDNNGWTGQTDFAIKFTPRD